MEEGRLVIRMEEHEKELLKKAADGFGYTLSEYIRRKLFHENEDLTEKADKYVSPYADKNNLVTISVLYKTFYLVKQILNKQGVSLEDNLELERQSLEFARKERERYGFKIIKAEDE